MKTTRAMAAGVLCVVVGLASAARGEARMYGGRYTAEKLANARANCEKYAWAKEIREKAVREAAPWVAFSDEELWAMVPGQKLPRCIDTTMDTKAKTGPKRLGCLVCGEKIFTYGNYPYDPDFKNKPWKLTCPSCKSVWPTNDFGKFYASALDEHGEFDPAKGDKSLLFNVDHPDPKDPLHTFGVDDGLGYIDKNGRGHRFIGYYTWKYWRHLYEGYHSLADAYVYTGDKKYAHKAAVLLDRLADVYPAMDWSVYANMGWFHSDGHTYKGKIEGAIWECGIASSFCDDYDKILSGTADDPELYAFLKKQAERYKLPEKGTRELFVRHVDDGLLRAAYKGVMTAQIKGNEGMHQRTMVAAALALDTQPESDKWLDWVFAPTGGATPGLMLDVFDRDGVSNEAAPGYALFWGQIMSDLGAQLADYPAYTAHNIFKDFPQFRAAYLAPWRMAALGIATPNIGDTGSTGSIGRVGLKPDMIATGYKFTKDPELAVAAYRANGNRPDGIGRDIFSKDPDSLAKEIEAAAKGAGPRPVASSLMTGYDLAILESPAGRKPGTAVTMNFGRTSHHAHPDQLNIDVLAFGNWLAPDHGYPEFATSWPSRNEWTNNTISHNLVVVDGGKQEVNWGGFTKVFKSAPGISVVQAEAPKAYPGTKQYQRTLFLIDTPDGKNAYAVDVFRVVGGKDHVYSFHGPPGKVSLEGIELVAQEKGTYAGEDVPLAASPKGGKFPAGYSYLYNVRRSGNPPAHFAIDHKAAAGYRSVSESDDIHLRLHALTACDDVALADGDPPQNKPGNPRRLPYVLMHRKGQGELASTFVSVIEPYQKDAVVKSVERAGGSDMAVAVKVTLADGSVDYILCNLSGGEMKADGGPAMTGALGFTRSGPDGKVTAAHLFGGTALAFGDTRLTAPATALTGKVVKMNKDLGGGGYLWVDTALPADGSLTGQFIHIDPAAERDACYRIESVEKDGYLTKVYCGPVTFVRGYAGPTTEVRGQRLPKDYTKGYVYDFNEGAAFRIPTQASLKK